jgi:hypothetical protein
VLSGASHFISAPLTLATDTTINVLPASSSLVITGPVTATGRQIAKIGAGRVQFENLSAAMLALNAGTVAISAKPVANSAAGASRLSGLAIGSGAALDLTDNTLILDSVSPSSVHDLLAGGFNGGSWNGSGINSSAAAAQASTPNPTALGFGTGAELGLSGSTFAGQTVGDGTVIIAYCFAGDANLDGRVNAIDFNILASNFGSTNPRWDAGDFNYDGVIDNLDFTLMAMNFNQVMPSPALGSVVPEPIALVPLATMMLLRRRRSLVLSC